MKLKNLIIALLLISTIIVFIIARHKDAQPYSEPFSVSFPTMSTVAEAIFYNVDDDTANFAISKVREKFELIENTCNIFNPESEISRLNNSAFEKPFKCSPLLWAILKKSREYYDLTDGAFDISTGPLMELWGFYRKQNKLPDEDKIEEVKKIVGLNKAIFNEAEQSVKFTVPGMRLDLGGIAKGFAVDLASEAAKFAGIEAGIINLGGNMYCFEKAPQNKKYYRVGIKNPFSKNDICGTVNILGKAVSTSGNYEKYVLIEGKIFTHIMNPKTCRPVEGMISVTAISRKAADADALSTGIFVQGPEFAKKLHDKIPDTDFFILFDKGNDDTEAIRLGTIWENCRAPSKKFF